MSELKHPPGTVRDAIVAHLGLAQGEVGVSEIKRAVEASIGNVPASSVRSYLRLRSDLFERTRHGFYQLKKKPELGTVGDSRKRVGNAFPALVHGKATLFQGDCFDWLKCRDPNSIHAVVTDPPYGLVEYTEREQRKLREGKGGVWRLPPSFDGHRRAPLPRFTTLSEADREQIRDFFLRFGQSLSRILVPGAHVFVASNPLLSHIVASALADSGLQNRGMIIRLVMTMRGGDRPKNAHEEFSGVTVMPRSMAEPWLLFRNPLEGRVQDTLRKWGTGGLRRISQHRPFGDVIKSHPTQAAERRLAPHPSLKPQTFLRQVVQAALPLGQGVVLDPFAGSASTLAAANHLDYQSIGVELSPHYVQIATAALPKLEAIKCPSTPNVRGAFECRVCLA